MLFDFHLKYKKLNRVIIRRETHPITRDRVNENSHRRDGYFTADCLDLLSLPPSSCLQSGSSGKRGRRKEHPSGGVNPR